MSGDFQDSKFMVSITSQGGKNKVKVYIIVDHGDSIGAEMGQTFPSSLFKTFLLFGLTEKSFYFFFPEELL